MTAPNIIREEVLVGLVGEVLRQVQQDLTCGTVSEQPGLYSGEAGTVLFLLCLYLSVHDDTLLPVIEQKLEFITNRVNDGDVGWSFANGLAGILWLLRKCRKYGICSYNVQEITQLEQVLAEQGKVCLLADNDDLLHGSTGIFWSLLGRNIKSGSTRGISEMEMLLRELFFPAIEKRISGDAPQTGDLGLAHGLTGSLLFLCKTARVNVLQVETFRLIRETANKILQYEFGKAQISLFPGRLDEKHQDLPSRLAWCYGDLGIAHALMTASILLRDHALRDTAIRIYLHAAGRYTLEETGISQAGFCHGSCGVAYLFLKGYHKTAIPELRETSIYWIRKSLQMHKDTKDHSLLEGKAGIGLTLLAATAPVIGDWDECFFLS